MAPRVVNGRLTGAAVCLDNIRTKHRQHHNHKKQVISVEPPAFMDLMVVDAPPGVKGNTASGGEREGA